MHPRRRAHALLSLAIAACALTAALSPGDAAADDGVLLVVAEVDEARAQTTFWWADPQRPTLTTTDAALLELLGELDYDVIDPRQVSNPPAVSARVFGRPDLSPTNALNLATLYGASRLISGQVRYEAVTPALPTARAGARVTIDLHLYSTNTTIELMPLRFEAAAYGPDEASARAAATRQALARVRTLVAHSASLFEAQVGVRSDEPVLVLTGLDHAQPLVEIKQHLKTREDVSEVLEVWAAEGVIAVTLNPDQIDPPERIIRAVDSLLMQRFEGFSVQEVSRDGDRVELMVLPTRQAEGR